MLTIFIKTHSVTDPQTLRQLRIRNKPNWKAWKGKSRVYADMLRVNCDLVRAVHQNKEPKRLYSMYVL